METLTSIQDAALDYLRSRTRHDHRVRRVAARMVVTGLEKLGWSNDAARIAAGEMWDVWQLERAAQ